MRTFVMIVWVLLEVAVACALIGTVAILGVGGHPAWAMVFLVLTWINFWMFFKSLLGLGNDA